MAPTRLALAALLFGTGCSLVTDTDWAHELPDGGAADMADLGDRDDLGDLGDMDPDMPDMPIVPVELCGMEGDEDGDGLADCADFDCLDDPGCCSEGEDLVGVSDWGVSLTTWQTLPTSNPPTILTSGGRITRFAPDRAAAVRWSACVPLALGAELEADLYPAVSPDPFPSCDGAGVCDEFVQFALSYAPDLGDGDELVDELSVRVYPGVFVEVRRANARLMAWDLDPVGTGDTPMNVNVQLTPSVADGSDVLLAEITIRYGAQTRVFTTDALAMEFLLDSGDCAAIPGLFVAFQGRGQDAGLVGNFRASTLTCPNPNQFVPPAGLQPLTRVELDWDEDFSGGGKLGASVARNLHATNLWVLVCVFSVNFQNSEFRICIPLYMCIFSRFSETYYLIF